MTETLLMLYTMFAAAGTFALLSLLGAAELRARRRRSRDAALRAKYLRIVMLYLLAGEGPAPRFPMIRRAGARLLLVETVAGLAGVTYGLDAAPLRRIVAEYGLDAWLLRRTARSRGYRRARCLLLLSRLPVGAAAADCAARYAASRNRYVRFQSLMVRLAADPSTALRLMAEYPEPFSACEVGEIMAVLRRGMLPIAYEPLIGSPSRNLRIVGLNIVRQFGIEEAERLLLRIVSGDEDPELVREALYTLCALRRPLTRRAVSGRLSAMPPAERKACCAMSSPRAIPRDRSGGCSTSASVPITNRSCKPINAAWHEADPSPAVRCDGGMRGRAAAADLPRPQQTTAAERRAQGFQRRPRRHRHLGPVQRRDGCGAD